MALHWAVFWTPFFHRVLSFYDREQPFGWKRYCSVVAWQPFLDAITPRGSQTALWLSARFLWIRKKTCQKNRLQNKMVPPRVGRGRASKAPLPLVSQNKPCDRMRWVALGTNGPGSCWEGVGFLLSLPLLSIGGTCTTNASSAAHAMLWKHFYNFFNA